jgi:5-methylcytosine-specific restriction endonuclease McrA
VEKYKEVVRNRDKVCQICRTSGSKDNPLTVHHIVYKRLGGSNTPENCILLCWNCHKRLHEQDRNRRHQAISMKVKREERTGTSPS